jgi:putative addiction module CopG family antidote
MSIRLSPEAEALVRQLIARGDYDNPDTVVDEALRVLIERDQHAKLKAEIAIGIEQIERGQVVEWTPDFLDRLKREADELVRSGKLSADEFQP